MSYQLEQAITIDFTTHNPDTAEVSDADVLPTCQVFEDTTDVPILTLAAVKRVGQTGDYRVSFTPTAADGFEAGKTYNVVATATVNGKSAKARILVFNIEAVVVRSHIRI